MKLTWTRNRGTGNYNTPKLSNGDILFISKDCYGTSPFTLYHNGVARVCGTLAVCKGFADDIANGRTSAPRLPAGDSRNVPTDQQMRGLAAELAAETLPCPECNYQRPVVGGVMQRCQECGEPAEDVPAVELPEPAEYGPDQWAANWC